MKTTLTLLAAVCAAAFINAGCASGPDRQTACDTARAAYEVYLADRELRQPTPEEVRWATAAALFLRTQCGWTPARGLDVNGVPIVVAP